MTIDDVPDWVDEPGPDREPPFDIPDSDECTCGHVRDEHEDGHGPCLAVYVDATDADDYCPCVHFEAAD